LAARVKSYEYLNPPASGKRVMHHHGYYHAIHSKKHFNQQQPSTIKQREIKSEIAA
jgi:hypothetical protein